MSCRESTPRAALTRLELSGPAPMTATPLPGASELAKPAIFSVGVAQAPITPPVGTPIAGFFHLRVGTHTRDELYAKAMVIRRGEQALALVSLELICVDALFVD